VKRQYFEKLATDLVSSTRKLSIKLYEKSLFS
jgi:hypothetical protein